MIKGSTLPWSCAKIYVYSGSSRGRTTSGREKGVRYWSWLLTRIVLIVATSWGGGEGGKGLDGRLLDLAQLQINIGNVK